MSELPRGRLLTLANAPTVAAYTAAGFWGGETIYRIAVRHARETPDAFAVRDRHRRLTYRALVEAADRLAAHLAGHGVRPGQRIAMWLPSRVETAVGAPCLLAQRLCLLPVIAPRPPGGRGHRADRADARGGGDRSRLWRDADADLFDRLAGSRVRQARPLCRPRRSGAVCRSAGSRRGSGGQRRPEPGHLSALHLRHHRRAEGRHAQRQHLARHGADDGPRLGLGAHRALHAEPAQPQSRARRADHGTGGRR